MKKESSRKYPTLEYATGSFNSRAIIFCDADGDGGTIIAGTNVGIMRPVEIFVLNESRLEELIKMAKLELKKLKKKKAVKHE